MIYGVSYDAEEVQHHRYSHENNEKMSAWNEVTRMD
jgi:hypothetical protein